MKSYTNICYRKYDGQPLERVIGSFGCGTFSTDYSQSEILKRGRSDAYFLVTYMNRGSWYVWAEERPKSGKMGIFNPVLGVNRDSSMGVDFGRPN